MHCSRGKTRTRTYLGFEARLPTLKCRKFEGISRNAFPRPDSSVVQPNNFADMLHLHERKDSKLKTSWQISVQVLQGFGCFFLCHQFSKQIVLSLGTQECVAVHLVQVDFQKTFPDVPNEFRVSGCKRASRLSIARGLGTITGRLGTWENPELLAVSGSWDSPKIVQRIHFVL